MRYAHVNGIQIEAAPGLKGSCPGCGNRVTAKCGSIKVHHWAHLKRIDCDPWWEPMTQWHLNWQNQFPKDWREVIFSNPDTKEYHRADVHTPGDITLEFQYSAISPEEIESRNAFYAQLIWIVNGSRFKNFQIGAAIPNPKSHLFAGYRIYTDQYGQPKLAHSSGKLYSFDDPRIRDLAESKKTQPTFYLFNWKYKHRA